MVGDDAILSLEGHHVRDGAEGREVEVGAPVLVHGELEFPGQALAKPEHHSRAGEFGMRIQRIGPVRVDQSFGVGQSFAEGVMVGHDHPHACLARSGDLLDCAHAAVACEEHRSAHGLGGLHGALVNAVALADAVGHVGVHIHADPPQKPVEDRGAADPVHVVVAMHEHLQLALPGVEKDVAGRRVVGQKRRVPEVVEGRVQEPICGLGVSDAAPQQQARDELGNTQRRGQFRLARTITRRDMPFDLHFGDEHFFGRVLSVEC